MKTPLTYGAYTALGNALLVLIAYFLGYHSDPAKLASSQMVMTVAGLAVSITGITLGIRARRTEIAPDVDFSYGRALGAGVLVALFAALFGTVFQLLYQNVINPDMIEVIMQQQAAAMEAKGLGSQQIEQAQKFMKMMFHPAIQFVTGILFGTLWGVLVALVAAAFLKRPAQAPTEEVPSGS